MFVWYVDDAGVILWELMARERPYAALNEFAIAYQVSTQGLTLGVREEWRRGYGKSKPAGSSAQEHPHGNHATH